jgi:hypothetical protein
VVVLLVVAVIAAFAVIDSDAQRYAVRWDAIEVSPDRRTITVVTSYPLAGSCVKEPDGVDITLEGSVAKVAAWMAAPTGGLTCTLECGRVTQTVALDEPLPEAIERLEPVEHAVKGCWPSAGPGE